ncbi:hypothetical protein EZV77_17070 [Burkholderia thailandensis]|uniref:Uncharacterized protein n=1 Tax=Burkholderia thailandensis TaxID=57975 RepID=A0AAW9CRU0_BURTH|nr:hypothetical protein [Burkholderia thailandensis]MDW9253410.1 hypothetical protein [Burkholderia thailandensis]PJO68867.1 hypothetical protein CWD92_30030 [Burkholderia thailandensis]TBW61195.1 hypothetical protein EZV77_17070 [Burkholderia thailandensis]
MRPARRFARRRATRDTRHATRDTRHATRDTRYAIRDTRRAFRGRRPTAFRHAVRALIPVIAMVSPARSASFDEDQIKLRAGA